jgi:hypothetical protein
MPSLEAMSEKELRFLDRSFYQHCIERHGLEPESDRHYVFDLNALTMTLMKW